MKLMPHGDYYVWECDWCASLNRTLWTRIDDGKLACGVCNTTAHFRTSGQLADCAESMRQNPEDRHTVTADL